MRLILFIGLLIAATANAQNFAVTFYGDNSDGLPYYWPKRVQPIGTNTTTQPPAVVLTKSQLENVIATNQPAVDALRSNEVYTAQQTIQNNIAALVVAYSNLQWVADNWASVTNLTTLRIAVKAEGDVLLKLKPVLQEMYKGQ